MSSIVVAWELGSGLGHVGRLRPIVAALVDRGHDVAVVGRDATLCQQTFGSLGARILQAPVLPEANPRVRVPCTFADVLHDSGFRHGENLSAAACAWRSVFRLVRPDLILADHSPTALLASRGLQTPTVVLGTGFLCPPDVAPLPSLRRSVPEPPWAAEIESVVLQNMNATLQHLAAPEVHRVAQLYADVHRQFLLTLPEIDHYSDRGEAAYLRPICEVAGEALSWPPGDRSRVFVYLKNHPALPAVLEALAAAEFSTICFAPGLAATVVDRLPTDRFRLVRQPQDIRAAAGESDVAVLNGGHGGTCEFLLAGKPVLVLPMTLEQQVTGQRVADLGAGMLGSLRRPSDVLAALRRITSEPEFGKAAKAFSARYCHLRQEDSLANIVQGIERCLSG